MAITMRFLSPRRFDLAFPSSPLPSPAVLAVLNKTSFTSSRQGAGNHFNYPINPSISSSVTQIELFMFQFKGKCEMKYCTLYNSSTFFLNFMLKRTVFRVLSTQLSLSCRTDCHLEVTVSRPNHRLILL